MTYHTILKTSDDFVAALRYSRELADNITYTIGHWHNHTEDNGTVPWRNTTEKVFPYRYIPIPSIDLCTCTCEVKDLTTFCLGLCIIG